MKFKAGDKVIPKLDIWNELCSFTKIEPPTEPPTFVVKNSVYGIYVCYNISHGYAYFKEYELLKYPDWELL